MKNRHTVRSSVFGVFLLFIISTSSVDAQAPQQVQSTVNSNEFPTAKVSVTKDLNTSWYAFKFIHEIPEWKAERLEERLVIHYPDLQSMEIDAIEKSVLMEVLNTAEDNSINKILFHFKLNGYEEL